MTPALLVPSLFSLTKKNPFDPPKPPVDENEVGFAVTVWSTNPSRVGRVRVELDDVAPERNLTETAAAGTAAPERNAHGVQCARCQTYVPYSTMSLNEDGAFCARCADELIAEAQDE